MAQSKKKPKPQQNGKYTLSKEQQKLLKDLEEYVLRKKTGKRQKIWTLLIASLLIILLLLGLWYFFIRPKHEEEHQLFTEGKLSVHFIDVGQGDSTLAAADGVTMLIDSGESEKTEKVINYLSDAGVEKIDYLIATHPHSDHMGGMYKVINNFDIGEIIIPHLADNDIPTSQYFEKFLDACEDKELSITEAKIGRKIQIGEAEAEIIAPLSKDYDNTNNYSICLYITHGNNSFLLTGDAEKESEKEMLNNGSIHHADVYKAGHHGSNTSSSKDFLKAVSPDYAVISCGSKNSYGHPHKTTINNLKKYTKSIFRTDLNGTIIAESDGNSVSFQTERT